MFPGICHGFKKKNVPPRIMCLNFGPHLVMLFGEAVETVRGRIQLERDHGSRA